MFTQSAYNTGHELLLHVADVIYIYMSTIKEATLNVLVVYDEHLKDTVLIFV